MDRLDSPLSMQAAVILQLIAAGRSYDQILMRHPELTYQDIFAAAQEALTKLQVGRDDTRLSAPRPASVRRSDEPSTPVTDDTPVAPKPSFVERARQTHHRAWARWTPDEDEQLERLFRRGAHRAEIGQALGRHNGAIRSRLVKLGLVSEGDDEPDLLLKPADSPLDASDRPPTSPPPRASFGWDGIRRRLEGRPERD